VRRFSFVKVLVHSRTDPGRRGLRKLTYGIVGSNPTGVTDACVFWTFALSGRGLCDGSIRCLEESYQGRVC